MYQNLTFPQSLTRKTRRFKVRNSSGTLTQHGGIAKEIFVHKTDLFYCLMFTV